MAESVSVGKVVPVPVTVAVCGLLEASSYTYNVAENGPEFVPRGAKATLMAHVPPATRLEPQSLVWVKLAGLVPPKEMLLMLRATL